MDLSYKLVDLLRNGCGSCDGNKCDFFVENQNESCGINEAAANRIVELESSIPSKYGCDCCNGDEALFWKQNEDCAFVDSKGEIMVVVNNKTMRFKVKFCPNCGRKF